MILALMLTQAAAPPSPPLPPPMLIPVIQPRGHAEVQSRFGLLKLWFANTGDNLVLNARDSQGRTAWLQLNSHADALAILSDRRLEELWAPLLAWAGSDLSKLRTLMLDRAEAAWRTGTISRAPRSASESVATANETRALLIYASALSSVGEQERAKQVLADWMSQKGSSADPYDVTLISLRLANLRWADNDLNSALAALDAGRSVAPDDSRYTVNVDINRAALLAEGGRYRDALALIDQTLASYENTDLKLAGSLRQFGWIRACALKGLGRLREAERAMAETREGQDVSHDRGAILPPAAEVRLRGYRCLDDKEGFVREMLAIAQQGYVVDSWMLMLQSRRRTPRDDQLLAAVRADSRVKAAYGARLRQLPPELTPALNSWRVDAPAAAR